MYFRLLPVNGPSKVSLYNSKRLLNTFIYFINIPNE